jgi:hypothetical protein
MVQQQSISRLDEGLVRNRGDGLRGGREADHTRTSWLNRLSLQLNSLTLLSGLNLLSSVLLDPVKELLSALGVLDVLDTKVDTLLNVSVSNNLLNNNTNRRFGDVVDNTSLTVVELVGHTLLNSTIGLYVNDISDLVCLQVDRHGDDTMLLKVTREGITSA